MSKQEEPNGQTALVVRRSNPYALNTSLAPVDVKQMRERIDPQGIKRDAKELVGQTFTIIEYRPIESAYDEGPGVFYYVKAVDADGVLFNTTLGGQTIVDTLNAFDALRAAHSEAMNMGDDARAQELEAVGATAPLQVKLGWVAQGKYSGYYVFE